LKTLLIDGIYIEEELEENQKEEIDHMNISEEDQMKEQKFREPLDDLEKEMQETLNSEVCLRFEREFGDSPSDLQLLHQPGTINTAL
jgi:hypothetical protein